MKMKKSWVAALLFGLFSLGTMAEEALKIAVVDIQRAVLQTEKAKAQLESLKEQKDFKENLESIEALEKEYKSAVEKYQKDRAIMSAEKREEEERRILDKQQDIKYIANKLQQAQKAWGDKVMQELGPDMQKVLQALIKEQNIGLLLRADAPAVISAGGAFDISATVTERLNAIK